jgi:hypothetical protein
MKKTTLVHLTIFLVTYAGWSAHAVAGNKLSFSPTSDIAATVVASGQDVKVTIKKGADLISEDIHVDTEKRLDLLSEDYNFDGYKDFSIAHLDDGMGTYTIYQIYIFSKKDGKFIAARPKCGEEFINIVLSKKKHTLTNSFFSENEIKTCTDKY